MRIWTVVSRVVLTLGVVVTCVCWAGVSARAGVIRSDRSDFDARRFGGYGVFQSVGQVFTRDTHGRGFIASGVYLGDSWMLTAAHVVEDVSALQFSIGRQRYTADTTFVHPQWDPGDLLAGYDLALVKLDRDVEGITPATRFRGDKDTHRFAAMVGFGYGGKGDTGFDTHTPLRKRGGRNVIDLVYNNNILLADFDSGSASDNAAGNTNRQGLEYLIAPGDSGGGLFFYENRVWQLGGIHSFGAATLDRNPNSDYGDLSGHTRLLAFNGWIDQVIGTASFSTLASGETFVGSLYTARSLGTASVPEPAGVAGLLLVGAVVLRRGRKD